MYDSVKGWCRVVINRRWDSAVVMRSKSSLRRADTEGGGRSTTKSVGFSTRRTRHYRKGGQESPSDASNAASKGRAAGEGDKSPRSSSDGEVEEPLSPMDSNTFDNGSRGNEGDSGVVSSSAAAGRDASPTVSTPNKGGIGGNHTTPLKWIRRTSLTGRSDSSRDDFLGTVPLEFPTQGQAESRPVKENLTSRALPDPSVDEASDDIERSIDSPDSSSKVPSSALARRQKTPMPAHSNRDDLSPFAESDDDEGILNELGDLTQGGTTAGPGADSRGAVQSLSDEEFQFSQPEGSKAPRPLATFPVPSPAQSGTDGDDDTEMHDGPVDVGVGDAVNGIEMDTDMLTQVEEDDEDTWQSPNQEPRMMRPSMGGSSQQLSPVLNAGDVDFSPTGVSESYGLGGYETPMTQRHNEAFSSIIPSSASQDGMLSEEMPTSVKRMRKGSGKKSIVSRTELKRILRHSSYSDGEASDFMESNGSRQMAGGFEISEIDEASKENFDMEQSSIPFRTSNKSHGSKDNKKHKYYMTPGAASDWSMTGPTQEWHVPVIDDTIEEEEEERRYDVAPTQVVHRPSEGVEEEEEDAAVQQQQGEGQDDAYAAVEKAQLLFYEVVDTVAGGGVTDDLKDVSELLDRTTEKMASEGAEVSDLIVEVLRNDLKRRTAAIKRKIEIVEMQQLEVKHKLGSQSRDKILADVEALGGWSEDVEEIFRERCKSAVVESKAYGTLPPCRVREDLLKYWGDIIDRFALEGEMVMETKRREDLEAECKLQDARVRLAEQETRAAEIIRRYGKVMNIENNGEEDHGEVLMKAVKGGHTTRRWKELEDKQEKGIKNLAKLMESRDTVVKEKEALEAKLAERQKRHNWHKCREYWGAVLRGSVGRHNQGACSLARYRELPCDIPRARKFETVSGLIVVVVDEPAAAADVRVHGSSSRRDISLPNGKFDCVWKAIAARGRAMLMEGASAEEVINKVVEYGDRVGRVQESARALRDEKGALGTCSRILCTERGKVALFHRIELPRGLGTCPTLVARVHVGVVLMTPYIDWEGNSSSDYRLEDVLVRHPFPLPIGGDLFAVGVRMHVMDAMAKLMEEADARRGGSPRSVKDNLAALVKYLNNSLSINKLTLLRDRAMTTTIQASSSAAGLNIIPNLLTA
ncbi:hypothetical protein FOL47_003802 [Perkinsus chesapeaki]|uniref:Uncharacterized protein n=1 Tax=Perkinsus chesapeaki TaxID=330153 RepID=A0A7J6M634_PERCH|nr:hypothetical protein FOL47_003802 [Perkinsus chesapeaki]